MDYLFQIVHRRMLDQHRLVGAQEIGLFLELIGIFHAANDLTDAATEMGADEFEVRAGALGWPCSR